MHDWNRLLNTFWYPEPGNEEEIQNFCKLNYDVTFPLTAKLYVNLFLSNAWYWWWYDIRHVNGDKEAPLYKFLKESQPGLLG